MKDAGKTKAQLILELDYLRQKVAQLETRKTERKRAAAKLSEAELRYHTLFEQSPDGVMIIDSETAEVLEFNDAACKQLGYSRDEFVGIRVFDFEALEQPEETLRHIRQIREQGIAQFITKHRSKQGEIKDVLVVSKPIDISGKTFHLSIHRDITESKQMEDELKLKAQLLDNATDFIFLRDLDGNFVYANETALRALGYTREEVFNLKVDQVVAPGSPWVNGFLLEELMAKGTVVFETADLCKDGSIIPVESHARFVEAGGKKLVLSSARDVTERRKLEETIRQLAHYDPVTGLPNRNLFNDRIALALAHAARYDEGLALMMMDLDEFKEINDTLGHDAGDKLLKDVGSRLVSIVRKTDTVSRMGGDEFVLLLTEVTNEEDVTNIAKKLVDAVRKPFSYDGHEFTVTASIGIVFYPTDGKDSNTLLKHADRALYYVKNKGRNGYLCYSPEMNGKSLK
jgi:diguanylate cyclase (GGDEF)-like protein/PAS domain S-box-containing protein